MGAKRVAWMCSLVVAAFILLAHAPAAAQTPPPQVRMRWQDFISGPDGAKRLASLQAAIQKMKSLNSSPKNSADYRRSWEYWANIHGYFGPQSPDGTVAQQIQWLQRHHLGQYAPYYTGITDMTPPDSIAKTVWATCQHSTQTQQALNFFGWHRMYLYYYERVLRWAAGDDTLRLPYWDYTDPNQVALPADFQTTTATLYDQRRDPDINTGASTLDPSSTNINDLLPDPDYFDYESSIEEGVHGYVHCTVGPTCPVAHMGDVPVAGNDPIFYSHHANIDRMWACWQKLHGTPAGTWQNQPFSFVDETGALQTRPVKDFLDSTTLGYVYDNVSDCARPETTPSLEALKATPSPATPTGQEKKMATVSSTKGVAVNKPVTSVDLALPRPQLEGVMRNVEKPGAVELVLHDVTADSPPGVLFNVYLVKKNDPSVRRHVGTISWFGAFGGHHNVRRGPAKKTLKFDVTDDLRALGDGTATGLTVVIEATRGRVPADPAKAEAERAAASKEFHAEAKVKIGSIELRQVPAPPKK